MGKSTVAKRDGAIISIDLMQNFKIIKNIRHFWGVYVAPEQMNSFAPIEPNTAYGRQVRSSICNTAGR